MAQDHLFIFRIKSGGNSKEFLKWCNLATISIIRVGRIKPPYRHLFKVNSVAALMTRTSISLENETIIMENWLIEYTRELDGWGALIWRGQWRYGHMVYWLSTQNYISMLLIYRYWDANINLLDLHTIREGELGGFVRKHRKAWEVL